MNSREQDIMNICSYIVQNYYHRNIQKVYDIMDEHFVWIGASEFQWATDVNQFKFVTADESKEDPVLLTNEEYHILRNEGALWIVYGRYEIKAFLKDGTIAPSKIRITFVLEEHSKGIRILHIHSSHAQNTYPHSTAFELDNDFLTYMKQVHTPYHAAYRIAFYDRLRQHRYVNLCDLKYIEAQDRFLHIFTKCEDFQARGRISDIQQKLPMNFMRIHRSYIVNRMFINYITRYSAILFDQSELPISRERYVEVEKWLEDK